MAASDIDTLAALALGTERDVTALLEKAFNLNTLGAVADDGAQAEALAISAYVNAAINRLTAYQNAILKRAMQG